MNRAEVFLGTTLESRYRLDVIVRESPDFLEFQGHDLERNAVVDIRLARALRGMSMEELLDAVDTFNAEAEQLRRLSNASLHVEQLLASGQYDGPDQEHLAYCVFAHTNGRPLSEARPKGTPPLSLSRAVAMLEPVAEALATAHEIGVFHGDVRPENMIVGGDVDNPTLKLVSFTRATRLGNAKAARTFSAAYAAPEHFKKSHGDGGVGPATDTYGLALCLVELVTGQPPLTGSSPTELYKQASDITNRPTLRARGASVSQEVDAIVERAVQVNPKLRWPNTREFWSALTRAASLKEIMPSLGIGLDPNALAAAAKAAFAAVPVAPSSSEPHPAAIPPAPSTPQPIPSIRPLDEIIEEPKPVASKKSGGGKILLGVLAVLLLGGAGAAYALRRKAVVVVPPPAPPPASTSAAPVMVASAPTASVSAAVSVSAPVIARPAPDGMIRVPAGTFTMGKDIEGKGDRLAHKVLLTHAFYIDRTEVTIEKYNACIEKGACTPRLVHLKKNASGVWGCNSGDKEHGSYPANCVDRRQALAYCNHENKRLPTEAEWEYAARGTDEREYPWGPNAPKACNLAVLSGMLGACGDRHGTFPVGSAPDGASPFGVLDMGGNVWEWVADDYAPYTADPATDPMFTFSGTPETPLRGVLRGGSWDYGPESSKTHFRLPFIADAGNASIGIRCALSE